METNDQHDSQIFRTILIIVIAVITIAAAWQAIAVRQESATTDRSQAYLSPLGEFGIAVPEDWTLAPESFEEEGVYSIQLEGPKNSLLNSAFEERYGISIFDENSIENDKNIGEFLNSSVGTGYLVASFDALSASEFTLSESIESWREEFLKTPTTAEGVSYSDLEEVTIADNPAYRYESTVIDQGFSITSVNYFILAPAAEIEVSIFPANSEFIDEAEEVVTSLVIASAEDLAETDEEL